MHEEALAQAVQFYQAGNLAQAEQVCKQILATDPSHADAWCYLGAICLSGGRLEEAVAAYQRASQLRPQHALAHNDLGVALAQQGKLDQAVAHLRQAIQYQPRYAEAYNNLGIVLAQQGKLTAAVNSYQQALQIKPDYAEAHSNLGLVLASLGQLAEAVVRHQQALKIKPDFESARNHLRVVLAALEQLSQEMERFQLSNFLYMTDYAAAYNELGVDLKARGRLLEASASFQAALRLRADFVEAHSNLGVTFQERGHTDEAIASLCQALALQPDFVDAHNHLGTVLESVGQLDKAIACYRQAIRRRPNFAEAHNNLGVALHKQGKYDEAVAHYRRALELKPDYPDAHYNLGAVLVDQGQLDEGVASYERALWLKPDYGEAHLGRAQAWLQMGDFQRGWPEFEWRWRCKAFPPRPFPQPVWDGSSLEGRTILLHAEQGLGDTLQFIRYAPLVKQRAGQRGQVIVECQEELLPLLATCAGIDRLVARGGALPSPSAQALPPFDTHAPLMSLPRILQAASPSLMTIPAEVPYVTADPELVDQWRRHLGSIPVFKIGIAWQGNPDHSNDRHRSIPLLRFAPLAQLERVQLFSLQKGPGTEQLIKMAEQLAITDLGSQFQTFQDTAAVLKNLDLVITVDSAVAHCAGALAVPAWVLLPYATDWRWLLHREDNPWYPTLRLFRQKQPGNWDEVLERVAQAILVQVEMQCRPAPENRT
jgi:tetratricopeptide (TPR) repeat protein